MRLWHKDLIKVLPRQQLCGQWRECCLIAKAISENGTPNHLLVNKIMNYPIEHFVEYSSLVAREMERREYKVNRELVYQYFMCYPPLKRKPFVEYDKLYDNWHNTHYLTQCYYNLEEKYDCAGITKEEWEIIKQTVEPKIFGRIELREGN